MSFKYNDLDFAVAQSGSITFKQIPWESTLSLFRLLHPASGGVPHPGTPNRNMVASQCAFRNLPTDLPVEKLEWRLKRHLLEEEELFGMTGTVTEFQGLERAAGAAVKKFVFRGEWGDLEPEEKFVRDPMRFLRNRFRDVCGEWRVSNGVDWQARSVKRSAMVDKAYWFAGEESEATLLLCIDIIKRYFCGVKEDDPVLVFTRSLGDRPACADGKWVGKMWNCNIWPCDRACENYSGLSWVRRGFITGFILATSNRAAMLKILEISHRNEWRE